MFLKKLHAQSSVTDDTVHLWVADEMTGVLFCVFLCFVRGEVGVFVAVVKGDVFFFLGC